MQDLFKDTSRQWMENELSLTVGNAPYREVSGMSGRVHGDVEHVGQREWGRGCHSGGGVLMNLECVGGSFSINHQLVISSTDFNLRDCKTFTCNRCLVF